MNGTSRGTGERITLHQKPKKGDRAATTKSTYQSLNTPSFLSVGLFLDNPVDELIYLGPSSKAECQWSTYKYMHLL